MFCLRILLAAALAVAAVSAPYARGQESLRLAESFAPGVRYRVELKVDLNGRMTVPVGEEKKPQQLTVAGASTLLYEERTLPPDTTGAEKVIRSYRQVEFRRTIGDRDQRADLRDAVRRVVVLRSPRGSKSPFSPDGPLTWNEIDVVRNDVFCPVLVPGLLPTKPVRPGDQWLVPASAVVELTDAEKIDEGGFTAKLLAVTPIDGRQHAKLSFTGSVKGVDDHGPCRHAIDGTAYFDLAAGRLAYLSIKGTHELLDGAGKVAGRVDGQFVMKRSAAPATGDLSDAALKGVDLNPTVENSVLLYDNPDLGVRFLYPRRWRVGAVQGRQVTLDGPNGAGILITLEPPARLPTANAYLAEVEGFLRKEKAPVSPAGRPERVRDRPALDRFALATELGGEKVRMEHAVLTDRDGGATVAARLPAADAAVLGKDVDRVLKDLAVTKAVK